MRQQVCSYHRRQLLRLYASAAAAPGRRERGLVEEAACLTKGQQRMNVPPRGIAERTVGRTEQRAQRRQHPWWRAERRGSVRRAALAAALAADAVFTTAAPATIAPLTATAVASAHALAGLAAAAVATAVLQCEVDQLEQQGCAPLAAHLAARCRRRARVQQRRAAVEQHAVGTRCAQRRAGAERL